MKLVQKNEYFAVFDDLLKPEDFNSLWLYVQDEDYEFVNGPKWYKTFRMSDGNPLEGCTYISDAIVEKSKTTYPSKKGIDILIQRVKEISVELEEIIGKRNQDWDIFTARSYLYPRGCGLSWHNDHDNNFVRTGAFIFYTHPYWNVQWGGELMLADLSSKSTIKRTALENEPENKLLLDQGIGYYIFPKPNRLVLISIGTEHMIKKVEDSAGDHVRSSITGFFIKMDT